MMNRIFITGDKHGDFAFLKDFCKEHETTTDDVLIVLGDAGLNFYLGARDKAHKNLVSSCPITVFCVHGNHEARPYEVEGYLMTRWNNGLVYYEKEYPNILFACDGEVFDFKNRRCLVIGGAYSVDKYYRLQHGYTWFESEQPSEDVKFKTMMQVKRDDDLGLGYDAIFSHTCPEKFTPTEMFMSCVDQSTVDHSTECFLDEIEESADYDAWYCGHWHTDKDVEKMHFLYHNIIEIFADEVNEDGK